MLIFSFVPLFNVPNFNFRCQNLQHCFYKVFNEAKAKFSVKKDGKKTKSLPVAYDILFTKSLRDNSNELNMDLESAHPILPKTCFLPQQKKKKNPLASIFIQNCEELDLYPKLKTHRVTDTFWEDCLTFQL